MHAWLFSKQVHILKFSLESRIERITKRQTEDELVNGWMDRLYLHAYLVHTFLIYFLVNLTKKALICLF